MALLLTIFVLLCVDAAAVALDSVLRTLVDVDILQTLVERGTQDLVASVDAFSDLLNEELALPSCIDHVDIDVFKLTPLLHGRRCFNVAGRPIAYRKIVEEHS